MTSQNRTLRWAASTMYSTAGANGPKFGMTPIKDGTCGMPDIVMLPLSAPGNLIALQENGFDLAQIADISRQRRHAERQLHGNRPLKPPCWRFERDQSAPPSIG